MAASCVGLLAGFGWIVAIILLKNYGEHNSKRGPSESPGPGVMCVQNESHQLATRRDTTV
jgi:hypothetical protein